jgi:hypothetical protein
MGRALFRRTVPPPSCGPRAAEGDPGREALPSELRIMMARNRSRACQQTADDLPRSSNHTVGQPLSSYGQFNPLSAYSGVGTGSHQRSTHQRDGDRRTPQRRTTASRVDPSRREGSRRRPSAGSRPGRPPRHCGPDTASRHQQSRPASSHHQVRTNTAVPQPVPNTALDAARSVSPTTLWHSTIRPHMYMTAARVDGAARPPHQTPHAHADQDADQRADLAEGGGGNPLRHPQHLMAETGDLRACNADATVTCGDGRRDS